MPTRQVLDRCPGVLRPFTAADGAIVRLRLPGGRTRAGGLADITAVATRHGAPFLQVTSRGNLQLRALPHPLPDALVEAIADLDLLPSPTHERVRNIVADAAADLDELVTELDIEVRRSPALAQLSGRWLFALADTTGLALQSPYDVAYQSFSPTDGRLLVAGHERACPREDAAAALVGLAHAFVAQRSGPEVWNVRDLPAVSQILDGFRPVEGPGRDAAPALVSSREFGVPLGLFTPALAEALVDATGREAHVVVTHRRSVIVREPLTHCQVGALLDAGFLEADDPRRDVTACIGAPFCRRTTSPTVDLARALPVDGAIPRTHLVGCERACGQPTSAHVLVLDPRSVEDVLDAIGAS